MSRKINTEWENAFRKMNEETFGKHNAELVDKFTCLESKIEEDRWVDLKNGEEKKVKIKDAIIGIHDDVKSIKKIIQPLADFSNLHSLLKKYKLYWLLLFVFSSAILREIILLIMNR